MADTTTTVSSSGTLPSWAQPYYETMMGNAQQAANTPFQSYTDASGKPIPTVAGLSGNQQNAIGMAQDIANEGQPAAMTQGQAGLTGAMTTAQNAGNINVGQVDGGYQASGLGSLGSYNPTTMTSGNFDSAAAKQYMNPFVDTVANNTANLMNTQFGQQMTKQSGAQKQAGAFGGYRSDLQNSEAQKNQNLAMGNTMGNLYSTGYQQAQQQFNADQARGLQAQQGTEQSRQFGANLGLQGYQAQEAARQAQGQQTMQGQSANATNQLGLGQLQVSGANAAGNMGLGLANTAVQERLMYQNAEQGLERTGALEQQTNQNALTSQYDQFRQARDYPMQQQSSLSGILHGVPMPTSNTTTTTVPPPNIYSQLAGLGMGAVGLNNLLGK